MVHNFVHFRALHQRAKGAGRQAQNERALLGGGGRNPRCSGEGRDLAKLVAGAGTPGDPRASALFPFDDDAPAQNKECSVVGRALAQQDVALGHFYDRRANEAFLTILERNRSKFR